MRTKLLRFPLLLLLLVATAARAQTPALVADIMPGTVNSYPSGYVVFNGKLYFATNTPNYGNEWWVYDGINAPSLAFDLNPGTADGAAGGGVVFNNKLYFVGWRASPWGTALFSYDGTNPPALVTGLTGGSGGAALNPSIVFDNKLVGAGSSPSSGLELSVYDGVNTNVFYDLNPSGSSSPKSFCEFNGKLYFQAKDATAGDVLFGYDPVANTVSLLWGVSTGIPNSGPDYMVVMGNKMYFRAISLANGRELYSYDGTTVTRLTDLAAGAGSGVGDAAMIPYNGKLYLSGSANARNYQLYAYDPASGNTTLVYAMDSISTGGPAAYPVAVYHGQLYVVGYKSATGFELWATDGATTTMLPEIAAGASDAFLYPFPALFQEFNGSLYFTAGDPATTGNRELYKLTTPASVQSVRFDGSVAVYPNPASRAASLELRLQSPRTVRVSLTDAMGRTAYESAQVRCATGKTILPLPMETLVPGVYLYRVLDAKEGLLQSGPIGKQ